VNLERPLPQNVQAEEAIIAALLLDANQEETDKALQRLQPTDFLAPNETVSHYGIILREIKRQVEGGHRPDVVALGDALHAHGDLEKIPGGYGTLGALLDGCPRVSHLSWWVDIIKEKAALRQAVHVGDRVRELALSANGNAGAVLQEIADLSAHLRVEVGQKRILAFLSGAGLAASTAPSVEWILPGFIAAGAITELGARVKAGKTTMVLGMVRAVLDGLDFLGMPTLKTPCVYLSEQPLVSFREAMKRAGLLGREDFLLLPHGAVRGMPWPEVAGMAVAKCKETGARLLIVDTLPQFAGLVGDAENNAGDALASMQPLQRAADEGIGVEIIRHERKSGGEVGDSSRGSSAFAGAVDVVVSLRRPEGNGRKTMRLLQALSRFEETPAQLSIELVDGVYVSHGDPHEASVKEARESILATAPKGEPEAVTLKELAEGSKVARATAQRAVEELYAEKMLNRIGEGKKGNPFRYFVPENSFLPNCIHREEQNNGIEARDSGGSGGECDA